MGGLIQAVSRDNPCMPTDKPSRPLSERERDRLEELLDALPPPLEPLDLSALDGFLVGVLLQPRTVPSERWLPHVADLEGRAAPPGVDMAPILDFVLRRHAELEQAIATRQWFDPWVFELEAEAGQTECLPSQVVLPWVAGFAAALDLFPLLLQLGDPDLREPLATLYAHFDPDDLEEIDDLRELIDELAPPESVSEAVEDLVGCALLLADVSRPRAGARGKGPRHG